MHLSAAAWASWWEVWLQQDVLAGAGTQTAGLAFGGDDSR
jgi:hypothetical protein